jgi:hypothetical protein
MLQRVSDLDGILDKRPKLKKWDMRFGTWNIRSIYRAGSLRAVAEVPRRRWVDNIKMGLKETGWVDGVYGFGSR